MATAYATTADLPLLGVASSALTSISTPAQQSALDAACDLADSYLRAQFELPLTAWGVDLKMRVCEIAAWLAVASRGFDPENSADMTIRKRYEDACKWFEGVAAEKIFPSVTDATPGGTYAGHKGPFVETLNPSAVTDEDGNVIGAGVGYPRPRGW